MAIEKIVVVGVVYFPDCCWLLLKNILGDREKKNKNIFDLPIDFLKATLYLYV